jgi:hypothetical protein
VYGGTRVDADSTKESTSFTISTGGAPRELPLRIAGDWQVRFSAGSGPIFDCDWCGHCPPAGTSPATTVQLTLPQVHDGFSDVHASAWVQLSKLGDDGAETAMGSFHVGELAPGTTKTIERAMPLDDGEPYRVCFTLRVTDARDDRATDRFCTDGSFPAPVAPTEAATTAPDLAREHDHEGSEASSNGTSTSCSMSGHASGSASALAALVVLGTLSRRRRTRSAP